MLRELLPRSDLESIEPAWWKGLLRAPVSLARGLVEASVAAAVPELTGAMARQSHGLPVPLLGLQRGRGDLGRVLRRGWGSRFAECAGDVEA